jgi:hypothetical protein
MPVLPDTAVVEAGRLCVGGTALSDLACEHGTPLYVYDEATLRARARAYRDALAGYPGSARAVYACKANATVGLLRVLVEEGMGMDVASEGEVAHALAAGAAPERLVVHGNNKSDADVRAAVAGGAGLLVVDHLEELDQVERIAAEQGREQPVLLRVTPGIEADTHAKIQTAHAASKFGMAPPARTCGSTASTSTWARRSATSTPTWRRSRGWRGSSPPPGSPSSTSAAGSRSPTRTTTTPPTCTPPSPRRRRPWRGASILGRSSSSSRAGRSSAPAASRSTPSGR